MAHLYNTQRKKNSKALKNRCEIEMGKSSVAAIFHCYMGLIAMTATTDEK